MLAEDVTDTLDVALAAFRLRHRHGAPHKPSMISDNGPSYMSEVRGAPMHRQNQGKIERWH